MHTKILRIGLMLVLALVAVLPAMPATAQDHDPVVLSISGDTLNSGFEHYAIAGFAYNLDASVTGASVKLRDMEIILNVSLEPDPESELAKDPQASGFTYQKIEWTVVLAPGLQDGTVQWRPTATTITDGTSNTIMLSDPQMRRLAQTTRAVWNLYFEDSVRTAIDSTGAKPTGQPRVSDISITGGYIEITITFQADRPMRFGLDAVQNPFEGLTDWSDMPARSASDRILISESQFNKAFASFSLNFEEIKWLTVSFADGSVRFMMNAPALCNNEVIEGVFQVAPPPVHQNGLIIFVGDYGTVVCEGKPLDQPAAKLGNFEIQDFMRHAFERVVLHAAGDQKISGIELDSANGIIAILIA